MTRITAKLENISRVLEQIKADIKNRIMQAGQKSTENITKSAMDLMKEHAPIAFGALRDSIGKKVVYGYPVMYGISATGLKGRETRAYARPIGFGFYKLEVSPSKPNPYAKAVEYGVPPGAYEYTVHGRHYEGVPPWGKGSRLYEWVRLRGLAPFLETSARIARKIAKKGIPPKHFVRKSHSVLVGLVPDIVRRIFDKHLHF